MIFNPIEPVGYLQMLQLIKNSALVLTDSGGLQKEAYFFKKPIVILRSETEWKEIESSEVGIIADADENKIIEAHNHFKNNMETLSFLNIFGDGHAAEFICEKILGTK